jgi:hypothetical protein
LGVPSRANVPTAIFVLGSATLALAVGGCSDDEPLDTSARASKDRDSGAPKQAAQKVMPEQGGSKLCSDLQNKFIDCELGSLVSNGSASCAAVDSPATDECQTRCLLEQSCGQLASLLCVGESSGALGVCSEACVAEAAVRCDVVLPAAWVCDGEADCTDGSDDGAGGHARSAFRRGKRAVFLRRRWR